MALSKYRLGELIELCDERNEEEKYKLNDVKGISIQKKFIETKANMDGVSLLPYILVKPDFFAYVTVTSRNGEKITIAHNKTENTYIVSSSYIVFRVSRKDILLSDYLFIFFNRPEFDRYSRFNSWGSARETFDWDTLCDIEISLPPIEIQQKYVAIYKAMQENLSAFESRLDDLKLVCDGYIEDLRRRMPCEKIGQYIVEIDEKNVDNKIDLTQGVDVNMHFIPAKREAEDREGAKIVRNGQFAFNKVVKSNGTKLPIAFREGETCVISSSYTVFEITNENKLVSQYLMLWLSRAETHRYCGYKSYGTTRDVFTFDDMCNISIPIPDIKIQQSIVNVFRAYLERQRIADEMREQLKNICPVLIKGSIEEGA